MKNKIEPVIVEQIYNSSINSVWDAITKLDQMRKWFFSNIESFIPEVGFTTQFMVQSNDRDFLHLWKFTEVIPKKKIVYNWKYEGYEGDSFVTFELFELENKTKLRLTHQVTENFPKNIHEFLPENCSEGWNYFIKINLKEFLERKS